jgi:hypothetical protein
MHQMEMTRKQSNEEEVAERSLSEEWMPPDDECCDGEMQEACEKGTDEKTKNDNKKTR